MLATTTGAGEAGSVIDGPVKPVEGIEARCQIGGRGMHTTGEGTVLYKYIGSSSGDAGRAGGRAGGGVTPSRVCVSGSR